MAMISCRSGFTPRFPRDANWKLNMDEQDGRDEKFTLAKLAEDEKVRERLTTDNTDEHGYEAPRAPIRN